MKLAQQLSLLAVGSATSCITLAILALVSLSGLHEQADKAAQRNIIDTEAIVRIDQTGLALKIQVQEWKNLLLRSSDANSLKQNTDKFLAEEANVQKLLQESRPA